MPTLPKIEFAIKPQRRYVGKERARKLRRAGRPVLQDEFGLYWEKYPMVKFLNSYNRMPLHHVDIEKLAIVGFEYNCIICDQEKERAKVYVNSKRLES